MVTPGAGYVGPVSAVLIGLVAGALSYWTIIKKGKFGYDDSLDVVGIHGVAGVFGMVMLVVGIRPRRLECQLQDLVKSAAP